MATRNSRSEGKNAWSCDGEGRQHEIDQRQEDRGGASSLEQPDHDFTRGPDDGQIVEVVEVEADEKDTGWKQDPPRERRVVRLTVEPRRQQETRGNQDDLEAKGSKPTR